MTHRQALRCLSDGFALSFVMVRGDYARSLLVALGAAALAFTVSLTVWDVAERKLRGGDVK